MIAAALVIWAVVVALGWVVWRREGAPALRAAGRSALEQAQALSLRLPLALLAASFLMLALPVEGLSVLIGPASGLGGIAIAAFAGAFLPGGPMTSFPIALVFLNAGAGTPQIVALIAGWSVFALHRLLAYEAPIMGWQFVFLRVAVSLPLPILAGLTTQMVEGLLG